MHKLYTVNFELGKKGSSYAIFSLPQTNEYQEIRNLSMNPKPAQRISGQEGNEIVCFRLNDVRNPVVEFSYLPKSVNTEIPNRFTIDDYRKSKKHFFFSVNNRFINGDDKRIKVMTKSVVQKEKNLSEIIQKLYSFTFGYLTYGNPIEGLYSYSQAIDERVTDCGGFSTFLLSLLQSVGIPGRLVIGFLLKKRLSKELFSTLHVTSYTFHDFVMHAWLEVLLPDGSWFPLDPSIEWKRKRGLTKRKGGLGEIPADRLITSFGQDFSISINGKKYRIDLLQHPVYL